MHKILYLLTYFWVIMLLFILLICENALSKDFYDVKK